MLVPCERERGGRERNENIRVSGGEWEVDMEGGGRRSRGREETKRRAKRGESVEE